MSTIRVIAQDSAASGQSVLTAGESGGTTLAAQDVAVQPAVPERTGPPDTSYYMKLGYAVAGAIFLAYILLLLRRVASVRKPS